jgi:tetratricopeptide (TPR) repeat protein
MRISKAVLAALLATSASAAFAQQPTAPAPPAAPQAPAQPERQYNLSRAERAALQPALQAVGASDWAAATAALPAADAAAQGADAKYVIGQIRLRIGINTNDAALQARAVDDLIASGAALPAEMPGLLQNQAQLAAAAGDRAKADRALAQLAALNPNDPNARMRMAQARIAQQDWAGALQIYQQIAQAEQQAGRAISEDLRKLLLTAAYRGRMGPQAIAYVRELVTAFPTMTNWHDALVIYGELGNAGEGAKLDIYRLMRAVGAMSAERDYVEYADAAMGGHMYGEVKAVLEEGLARNAIATNAGWARERLATANQRIASDRPTLAGERTAALAGSNATAALRTGDAFFSYGQYAEAAELYRAALQKGASDANLANMRLGEALALGGQRAEAEAAFRAVTGPRAELAQLWLLWLSRRG